jgi:hypothetical protein
MGRFLNLRNFSKFQSSAIALIAANALALFGVLFLGWDTFTIVFLYWAENVVIGAINVLKMLVCSPNDNLLVLGNVDPNDKLNCERMKLSRSDAVKMLHWSNQAGKLFFVPFFIVHYGMFCLVHGAFIFAIFGRASGIGDGSGFGPFGGVDNFTSVLTEQHLWLCLVALAASHLISFFTNYMGRGEYRLTTVPEQMFRPYGRIVILHVAILVGGIIAFTLGSNFFVLLLLVAGKTLVDLSLHLYERQRNEHTDNSWQQQILPEVIIGEATQTPAKPPARAPGYPPLPASSDG